MPVDSLAGLVCHDATLQMCVPSLELPFDEFPSNFRFGGRGRYHRSPVCPRGFEMPDLFRPFVENSQKSEAGSARMRVVTVAQGTLAIDYDAFIVPTIQGSRTAG